MGTIALIGLGSNLGDRKSTLDDAIAALRETPGLQVLRVSSYHETAPAGGPTGQDAFLNAVVQILPSIGPVDLLHRLQEIENLAGRVRREHWGARTLDLDLLIYGRERIESPELIVPHPRMAVRRFVLAPAAEVAPHALHVTTSQRIEALLANLDRRPSYVALTGPPGTGLQTFFHHVTTGLHAVGLYRGATDVSHVELLSGIGGLYRRELHLDQFREIQRELMPHRWPSAAWGDRWIATDFWWEESVVAASLIYDPDRFRALEEEFQASRDQILRPSFVALWEPDLPTFWSRTVPPDELETMNVGPYRNAWDRHHAALIEHVHGARCTQPLLRIGASSPDEAAAEVLAACEASRPVPGVA